MDTSLWDSSYYQDYSTPQQSNHCNECHLLSDFCLCFHRDVIEEDALNVKSCKQVLDKLTDKADEEIKKLEEDILMLQCQLAWDDEDWSKTCSAAVNEKIDHLNGLIQSLKGESEEYMHNPDLQSELSQSLHDLLKPLFENYLVKSKQRDSNVTQVPIIPTIVCNSEKPKAKDDKNIEEKKCTTTLKISGRKESTQLETSKSNDLQQVHPIANDLSIPMAKDLTVSVPMEKDLTVRIPMAKDLTISIPIKKANASKREETNNKDKGAISEAKDTQHELRQENEVTILHLQSPETEKQVSGIVKVDSMKQRTETPRKVRKARANGPNTKVVVSRMPPANIRNEVTTFPGTRIGTGREHPVGAFDERAKHAREMEMNISSEVTTFSGTTIGTGREHPVGAFAEQAKHAREMEMNLEHLTPVQQRQIETLRLKSDERAKHAREMETNMEHQTQVHQRQIETLRPKSNSLIIYERQGSQKKLKAAPQNDQNLFRVKITEVESSTEIVKDISKGGTEHQPDGNNIAFSSTSSTKLHPGSQPIMKEARGVFNKLTVNELKAIAKERGLRGYSKHTKAAMLELLAKEPPSKE